MSPALQRTLVFTQQLSVCLTTLQGPGLLRTHFIDEAPETSVKGPTGLQEAGSTLPIASPASQHPTLDLCSVRTPMGVLVLLQPLPEQGRKAAMSGLAEHSQCLPVVHY